MKKLTIGILSPLLDGFYYGNLHYAIYRHALKRGVRIITVRSMNESRFDLPLANEQVDGWIVLRRGVRDEVLEKLQRSGKPVTIIGRSASAYHSIQIDERESMCEATMHLIEHGHRDIAFIGDINHPVMKERFEGYQLALRRSIIDQVPERIIVSSPFLYSGGAEAADRIIEQNFPCTAAVASSDVIAMGFIDRLREKGFRVPDDLAVIGFDDISPAGTYHPPLTTIEQPYEEIGETAVDWILNEIVQSGGDKSPIILKTRLSVRRSCGCACSSERVRDNMDSQIAGHAMNIKVMNYLEQVIQNNMEFGKMLFHSASEGISKLSDILPPGVRWGLLALWENERPAGTTLRITHYFHKNEKSVAAGAIECLPGDFPPLEKLAHPFTLEHSEMLALIPVRTESREWGVLALAGEYDITRTYGNSDAMTHFFNMIAFSLEREQLFEEVRTREEKFRKIAERLEIVSAATTDGIWEWDLVSDKIECNASLRNMLRVGDLAAAMTIHDFIRFVHPDDRDKVEHELYEGWADKDSFNTEFRIVPREGETLWVFCVGSCIRDRVGPPVRIIGSVRDITKSKENERKIRFLAFHDSLTGLPNRLFFAESLKSAIEHAARHNHKLALLLLDLDEFKAINDNYGHQMGDRLLQFVAGQLAGALRLEHVVARLGGDEFVVLLPFIEDENEVTGAAQAVLAALREPFVEGDLEIGISGSLGLSIYPHDGEDPETLMGRTDSAMYRAKNSGKNKLKFYRTGMDKIALARTNLESRIARGLEEGQFAVYYQPQVDLRTGRICGAEALLRWKTRDSILLPDDFIPIAEQCGLILPLGRFALEEACRQLVSWQRAGLTLDRMMVNVSSLQLEEPSFFEMVMDMVESIGIEPGRLCLDVAETAALENTVSSIALFERLCEIGVEISLDDFGAGYSSLVSLKRYPIGHIKIDRAFIGSLHRGAKDASIVRAIIALAHSLGLSVMAEGVETGDELDILKEMRCDCVQGFLIDKPLSAEEFADKFLN